MKKTYLFLLITMLLLACGEKGTSEKNATGGENSEILKAVDAANELTPAPTWDGEYMQSIKYVESENIVEFRIKNAHAPNKEMSKEDLVQCGMWYVANFMTGFDSSMRGSGGEGDEELYLKIEKILDLLAENEFGLRINLECKKNRGDYLLELSSTDVKKAIKMRKEDFFN